MHPGRPSNVLGETLPAFRVGEAPGVVDAEPGVAPGQKVPRELLGQELLLYEKPDEAAAEHFGHPVEPGKRHGDEPPILLETAFQHQAVLVRIPAQLAAEGLMRCDDAGQQWFAGCSGVELRDDRVDQAGDFGEQQRPLLAARRAQGEALAAERSEVVMSTRRAGAPNASHSEPLFPAGQEPLADLTAAIQPEHPVGGRIRLVVDVAELVEMPFEDRVELIAAPGDAANPGRSRGSSSGGFHALQDGREVRRASPRRLGAL